MSLIKLLTVSRSFMTGQIPTGRYRMVRRQGGLPQFGPTAHSADAPVARRTNRIPVPCQSEFPDLDLPDAATVLGAAQPPAAPIANPGPDSRVAAGRDAEAPGAVQFQEDQRPGMDFRLEPEKPVQVAEKPVQVEDPSSAIEGDHTTINPASRVHPVEPPARARPQDRLDRKALPAPTRSPQAVSSSPFAKSNSAELGSIGRSPKRAGRWQKTLQGLRDWMRPKPGRNSKSPFVGKPVRRPVQAHLKVESVQVIRNDLSDSDYEVRQAGLAAGVGAAEAPLLGRAKLGLLTTSWNQVTARWLESGRVRAQTR